jgi:hypothetical protein
VDEVEGCMMRGRPPGRAVKKGCFSKERGGRRERSRMLQMKYVLGNSMQQSFSRVLVYTCRGLANTLKFVDIGFAIAASIAFNVCPIESLALFAVFDENCVALGPRIFVYLFDNVLVGDGEVRGKCGNPFAHMK